MPTIHVERTIGAAPQRVFDWLADPVNLEVAPLLQKVVWAKDSLPPGLGATRVASGIGLWIREEITAYDPPRSYSYRIVRSVPVFDHEGGTLTFTPVDGGTHVDWVSTYTHPAYLGGVVLQALTSRLLPWNFRAVLDGCARELEA
jgi:uncharacterized protein YndB with AHSA1/START domain